MSVTIIIIILTIFKTIYCTSDLKILNFGTELFSPEDLHKKYWSKQELELLEARRFFQDIIPPPTIINTSSKDFIERILRLYVDAYTTIKNEAPDPETDAILTSALSDTIGGYLKMWLIPVAKLAYYGGTLPFESVDKVFSLYFVIKEYLNTDGNGWKAPDKDALDHLKVVVEYPAHYTYTRSTRDPCDRIAYYEKEKEELSAPLPIINWDQKPATMFIPLMNQSLLPLSSMNTKILFDYYNTVKDCLRQRSPREAKSFDHKFQSWISEEIVPHLTDDSLYVALGSILSLIKGTGVLYQKFHKKEKTCAKSNCGFVEIIKNPIVIIAILVIEIAWLVPALTCLFRSKTLKNKAFTTGDNKGRGNKGGQRLPQDEEDRNKGKQRSAESVYSVSSSESALNNQNKGEKVPGISDSIQHAKKYSSFDDVSSKSKKHRRPQKHDASVKILDTSEASAASSTPKSRVPSKITDSFTYLNKQPKSRRHRHGIKQPIDTEAPSKKPSRNEMQKSKSPHSLQRKHDSLRSSYGSNGSDERLNIFKRFLQPYDIELEDKSCEGIKLSVGNIPLSLKLSTPSQAVIAEQAHVDPPQVKSRPQVLANLSKSDHHVHKSVNVRSTDVVTMVSETTITSRRSDRKMFNPISKVTNLESISNSQNLTLEKAIKIFKEGPTEKSSKTRVYSKLPSNDEISLELQQIPPTKQVIRNYYTNTTDQMTAVSRKEFMNKETDNTHKVSPAIERLVRKIKKKGLKLTGRPYLEILLEKPHKETLEVKEEKTIKIDVPKLKKNSSKIPKRLNKPVTIPQNQVTPKSPVFRAQFFKSHIPMMRKKSRDDLALLTPKSRKNDDLNSTF